MMHRWSVGLLVLFLVGCGSVQAPVSNEPTGAPESPAGVPPAGAAPGQPATPSPVREPVASWETRLLLARYAEVRPFPLAREQAVWQVREGDRIGLLYEWELHPVWLVTPTNGLGGAPEIDQLPTGELLLQTGGQVELYRLGAAPERLFTVRGERFAQATIQSDGRLVVVQGDQAPLDRHSNHVTLRIWRWEEDELWSVPSPEAPRYRPAPATAAALEGVESSQWWLDLGDGPFPLWLTAGGALAEVKGELHRLKAPVALLHGSGARVADLDGDGERELLLVARTGPISRTLTVYTWDGTTFELTDLIEGPGGMELVDRSSAPPAERFTLITYSPDGGSLRYRYHDGHLELEV